MRPSRLVLARAVISVRTWHRGPLVPAKAGLQGHGPSWRRGRALLRLACSRLRLVFGMGYARGGEDQAGNRDDQQHPRHVRLLGFGDRSTSDGARRRRTPWTAFISVLFLKCSEHATIGYRLRGNGSLPWFV